MSTTITIPSILLLSSCIFITNAITAMYKNYHIYSALFVLLTLTSLLFHSYKNIYTLALDILAVCSIVLYGSLVLRNNSSTHNYLYQIIIVSLFLTVVFLFFYGYLTQNYCYHKDKTVSDTYHCLLHILSSIGHHFVIFL
jgi:hypothetical protein